MAPAVSGSPEAEEMCDRHAAALFSLAVALTGTQQRAEGVVATVIAGTSDLRAADLGVSMRSELARRAVWLCSVESGAGPDAVESGLGGEAHRQRAALVLVHFGDLTYAKVAELMDLEPTDVAYLLSTGLRSLLGDAPWR